MDRANDVQLACKWASDLLARNNFVILDSETTGLSNQDEIVQLAIIDSKGYPLLDSLVKPTVPITRAAEQIHGISREMLRAAPTMDKIWVPIFQAVGRADLVIFNAEFDLRLVKQALKPYCIYPAFPTSDRRGCRIFTNGGAIHCAMQWYSQYCGVWNEQYGNYRWQRLPGGDHSALGDCRATLELIKSMAKNYRPGLLQPATETVGEGF